MTDIFWIGTGNALYCLGFIMALFFLLREHQHPRWVLYAFIAVGYILQSHGLYIRGLSVHGCPVGNTFEIVQFIIWSLTLCFLLLGPAFRLSLFGLFTAGLNVILSVLSFSIKAWDSPYESNPLGANPWIEFHASLAMFSYGVFALLAVSAVLYLLQNRSLKQREFQGLNRFLPSLVESASMTRRMLILGTGLLTISLVVGSVYWIDHTAQVDTSKLVVTLLVWVSYSIVTLLRLFQKLVARRLAWTCIILFAGALISIWPVDASRSSTATSTGDSAEVLDA